MEKRGAAARSRGWLGALRDGKKAEGGWVTRKLGSEEVMESWGGGRARDRQNDSPWRRGWRQFGKSTLNDCGPAVNLTECFVPSGTLCISNPFPTECLILLHQGCLVTIRFQQNASFCCKQAAYWLPCFNRCPFNPLLLNCGHMLQQFLL